MESCKMGFRVEITQADKIGAAGIVALSGSLLSGKLKNNTEATIEGLDLCVKIKYVAISLPQETNGYTVSFIISELDFNLNDLVGKVLIQKSCDAAAEG
jgi:hypothetical protein